MTKRRRRRRRRRRRYEGAADQEGFPVFLSLSSREEKSRSKELRRTRSREEKKKEEEDEHLYKDLHGQWEWNAGTSLVPDFTPASSPPDQPSPPPSVPRSPLSSHLHQTLLLLLRLSSVSTADRDVAHRIITVFYLSTGFTIYYYTTVRAC